MVSTPCFFSPAQRPVPTRSHLRPRPTCRGDMHQRVRRKGKQLGPARRLCKCEDVRQRQGRISPGISRREHRHGLRAECRTADCVLHRNGQCALLYDLRAQACASSAQTAGGTGVTWSRSSSGRPPQLRGRTGGAGRRRRARGSAPVSDGALFRPKPCPAPPRPGPRCRRARQGRPA